MLLIDGVRYELWTPPSEDEFERVVEEHAQEIFGENSIYLDKKQKLKSLAGIGSIPDGYVITFGDTPEWNIVEVELSTHPLDQHIVSQVSRFITGINNPNIRRGIVSTIYSEIANDDFLRLKIEKAIKPKEIYYFLDDLISKTPILTIIIEKDTQGLRDVLATLAHAQIRVVEFQTFIRENVGLTVHAHLFEPVYHPLNEKEQKQVAKVDVKKELGGRVTIRNLLDAGIVKPGQIIFSWYKDRKCEARLLGDGSIELLSDSSKHDSLSSAGQAITHSAVNGWVWWRTTRENGKECEMAEQRNEYLRSLKGKG